MEQAVQVAKMVLFSQGINAKQAAPLELFKTYRLTTVLHVVQLASPVPSQLQIVPDACPRISSIKVLAVQVVQEIISM
jgi:hypothetical protein